MARYSRGEWNSLFEAMDACRTIDDLGGLAVTLIGSALGCKNGSAQEVCHAESSSLLRRHYVSGSLEAGVSQYVANFEKISMTLLGGNDPIYTMGSRMDCALEHGYDPRPIWFRQHIHDVLTMQIRCSENTEWYFTFNRNAGNPEFDGSDLEDARQLFPMLSATSRRLHVEELLKTNIVNDNALLTRMVDMISVGGRTYRILRASAAQLGNWGACNLSSKQPLTNSCRAVGEEFIVIRESHIAMECAQLTPAEKAVARLAALGHSNKEIANLHRLSVYTIENQLKSVYRKMNICGRRKLPRSFLAN